MIMKIIKVILVVLLFVSCKKDIKPEEDCEPVPDDGTVFVSCEQILNTCGLKLYTFAPFTDDFGPGKVPYNDLLAARQIPDDFLRKMTTKELFYQIVECELSKWMMMLYAPELRLNMIVEFMDRPDAAHVLLNLLQRDDPSVGESECYWWRFCMQVLIAQPEIINRMTEDEIENYIHHASRCIEIMLNMYKDSFNESCGMFFCLFYGLGNVMFRYEFEPFIQSLPKDPVTNEVIWKKKPASSLPCLIEVLSYIDQFLKLTRK